MGDLGHKIVVKLINNEVRKYILSTIFIIIKLYLWK